MPSITEIETQYNQLKAKFTNDCPGLLMNRQYEEYTERQDQLLRMQTRLRDARRECTCRPDDLMARPSCPSCLAQFATEEIPF